MYDLEMAKRRLKERGLTLSIVKNEEIIFESKTHGISSFLEAIEKLKDKLEGSSVADTVAGKAVAFLCVYANIQAFFAETLSRKAKALLEEHNIHHEWKNLVEKILNFNKTEACPFEKLTAEISDPKEAYQRLKEQIEKQSDESWKKR